MWPAPRRLQLAATELLTMHTSSAPSNVVEPDRPKGHLLQRLAISLLSFVLAFFVALVAWNFALGQLVGRHPGWKQHPQMGRVMKPGTLVFADEGFSRTSINSLGMRNGEIGPKTPGRTRVLCLGDSFTAGVNVPDGVNFVDQLRGRLGARYDLINAGRDGANPAYYVGLGPFYREKFSPDIVLVEITPLNLRVQMTSPESNFYVEQSGWDYRIVRNTKFVSNNPLTRRFPQFNSLISVPAVKIGIENVSRMLKPAADSKGDPKAKPKASAELCKWTVRSLHEQYPRLVLVYMGSPNYYDSISTPDEVADGLRSEASRLRVPFVEMGPKFRAHFDATKEMSHGFSNSEPGTGHINGTGHRLVAEAIAAIIEEMR
jgi:lysophospholipase L1-like esterase